MADAGHSTIPVCILRNCVGGAHVAHTSMFCCNNMRNRSALLAHIIVTESGNVDRILRQMLPSIMCRPIPTRRQRVFKSHDTGQTDARFDPTRPEPSSIPSRHGSAPDALLTIDPFAVGLRSIIGRIARPHGGEKCRPASSMKLITSLLKIGRRLSLAPLGLYPTPLKIGTEVNFTRRSG